jgi:glutathione-independent formaldehyde dehydrogenase
MYEGRTAAQPGLTFGHENMGIITSIGTGVHLLKVGDRVCMPFNVGCGRCLNCEQGKTGKFELNSSLDEFERNNRCRDVR